MRYPEIVNHTELEAVLQERESLTNAWPNVELLEIHDGIVKPLKSMNAHDLNLYLSNERPPECTSANVCLRIL